MKKSLLALGVAASLGSLLAQPAQAIQAEAASPSSASDRWQTWATSSDVDGDGTIDGISMRQKSAKVCQVRVGLGSGGTVVRSIRSPWGDRCRWHGTAPVDNVKGAEISVVTGVGAHTAWHTMLTWRNGRLVVEKPPHRARWTVDGTVMVSEGFTRTRNNAGQLRLVHDVLARDTKRRWKGTRAVLAHRGGRWVVVSQKRVTVKPSFAAKRAGWHVRGLPRWV